MKCFYSKNILALLSKYNIDIEMFSIAVCENNEEYESFQDQNSWNCKTFQNGEVKTVIVETNNYKIMKNTSYDNEEGTFTLVIKGWRD